MAKTDSKAPPNTGELVPRTGKMKSTRDLVTSAMALMDEALTGTDLDMVVKKSNVFNACATTIVKVTTLQMAANEKREKTIPWLISSVSVSGADADELDSQIRAARLETELIMRKLDDPATTDKEKPALITKSATAQERLASLERERSSLT